MVAVKNGRKFGPVEAPAGLTEIERRVLEALNAGDIISGRAICMQAGIQTTRNLRRVIWRLRSVWRIPVISWPGLGYELARDSRQVKRFVRIMQDYGRDFFAIASVAERVTADVIAAQMILDLFPGRTLSDNGRPRERADTPHAKAWELHLAAGQRRINFTDVLARLLDHIAANPGLYEDDLAVLRRRFGALLLQPEQVRLLERAGKLIDQVTRRRPATARPRRRAVAAAK